MLTPAISETEFLSSKLGFFLSRTTHPKKSGFEGEDAKARFWAVNQKTGFFDKAGFFTCLTKTRLPKQKPGWTFLNY
jgi:hypothetical protein